MIFSKKYISFFVASAAAFTFFIFYGHASAMTPNLTLSATGQSDTVEVDVTGDPNSAISLYYISASAGLSIEPIGTTNGNGTASTVLSTSQYGIAANASTYVVVNGQRSATETWPNITSASASTALTFSQTSLVLGLGQSSTITIGNNTGNNTIYVSNNSNPPVASISILNNQEISISALSTGSAVISICELNNSTSCASIYVTVPTQNSSVQPLTFNQNNVTVAEEQNVPIAITGGSGIYTILNNSNASIISASLNGSTITLSALGSSGSASITVCSIDMSACGIITATIGSVSTTGVSFSQTYPTLGSGQTLPISISGGSGTYYVSSNSNPAVISANISGNILNLYGNTTGTAAISICSTGASCATITPTVSFSSTGGAMTLSQTSLTLLLGQTLSVTISGGQAPYNLLTTSGGSSFQSSLSNNVITVTGLSAGSSVLEVCSASGGCTGLSITVNQAGVNTETNTVTANPIFSPAQATVNASQNIAVVISGGASANYYLASNSNPSAAQVSISGSTININGVSSGSSIAVICATANSCSPLFITVNPASVVPVITFTPINPTVSVGQATYVTLGGAASYYISSTPNNYFTASVSGNILSVIGENAGSTSINICSSTGSCVPVFITVTETVSTPVSAPATNGYQFISAIKYGETSADVTELQTRLTALGVYNGPITGFFGNLTLAAVKRYQTDNGLPAVGNVGPQTRALLNR